MMVLGPYEFKHDEYGRNQVWQPSEDATLDAGDLCASGFEKAFPDLDRHHRYELRLYAHRPRVDVTQVDVALSKRRNWRDILVTILDGNENRVDEVEMPSEAHELILDELGLDWDDATEIDWEQVGDTYIAWIRVVDLGEIKPKIENLEVEDWSEDSAELIIHGSNGFTAFLSVPLSDINWEYEY